MYSATRNRLYLARIPILAILSFFIVQNAFADANGRAGRSGLNGTTCATAGCHAVGAAVPMVSFTAPTSVMAGSVNNFTVTISGGPGVRAGIDVATSAGGGTLSAPGAGATISTSGEVVHSSPKPFSAGSASFSFSWTAPTTGGTATLYVAGMSDNGNGVVSGDGTTLITRMISVTGATNVLPVARISAPATGTVGVPVNFSGVTSTDADGTIATYAWNFGDGTAGAGVDTTNSFVAGTYTVTLTVTDNAGGTATAMQTIVIAPSTTPPVTVANPGGPYTGLAGVAVQFSGAASTGSISSYAWNFGDGTATVMGVSPTHVFATGGTFQVTLTVTDASGAVRSSRTSVMIDAAAADPTAGEALFEENCAGCHSGAGSSGGDITGEDAGDIMEAFAEYPVHDGVASIMTDEDIAAIAEYLNGGGVAPGDPGAGEALFEENCAGCHSGAGSAGGDITGEDLGDIMEAFEEYPDEHAGVSGLPEEDLAAIADFLSGDGGMPGDPAAGEALFEENCAGCHSGRGSPGGNITGEDLGDILEAFEEYPDEHAGVSDLPEEDLAAIADFLSGSDDDDDDRDLSANSSSASPGSKGSKTAAVKATAGSFDFLTLVGAGFAFAGAGRRRKK